MYIERVTCNGFKSYSVATHIEDFDREFNAITGENGSGKSNLLDAICFVLGISKLDQVRVTNLNELIYKQGQAGVDKASVTIVFNNSDPAMSPHGYEQLSQITVTRQVSSTASTRSSAFSPYCSHRRPPTPANTRRAPCVCRRSPSAAATST